VFEQERAVMIRWRWSYLGWLLALPVTGVIWLGDTITLHGERTIYMAECVGGTWNGQFCGGRLTAGPRYRYRALKAHGEVIFWSAGSPEPSGKLAGCSIESGRNWSCPPAGDFVRSPTLKMVGGRPVLGKNGNQPSHAVSKFTWLLLSYGLWPANGAQADTST
jgi:hypothetical protein